MKITSSHFLQATILGAFLASPIATRNLAPNDYEGGYSKNLFDQKARNRSAIGTIFGELRANFSDLMFIKTERYLHNGVAYQPHLDMNEMASTGRADEDSDATNEPENWAPEEHEHEHEHGEEERVATIIRTSADDFRGFIGYLEREVKPWRDPSLGHLLADGTELLPWYRLMTLSDPHNVRAYMIGAWWLKTKGQDEAREALDFIEEGIRFNPDSFQLYLMKGYILYRNLGRAQHALESFHRAADLAIVARPVDPQPDSRVWTDYHEEDARAALRMAVILEKEIGDRDRALQLARAYNDRIGGDPILERQIRILTGQEPDPAQKP